TPINNNNTSSSKLQQISFSDFNSVINNNNNNSTSNNNNNDGVEGADTSSSQQQQQQYGQRSQSQMVMTRLGKSQMNLRESHIGEWSESSEDSAARHSHIEDGYDGSVVNMMDDDDSSARSVDDDGSTTSSHSDTSSESDIEMDTYNSEYNMHDDEEEEKRRKRRMLIYKRWYVRFDFLMEHINIVLSVLSVGIYIALSYMNRRKYLKKTSTILDIISLLPIFVTLLPNSLVNVVPLGFLRILRILKAPRIFKLHGAGTIWLKTSQLLLSLFIFIILFASMITSVEGIPFHTSIYYAVVTLSTVGYGDITPQTNLGRILASVMILMALMYLPLKSSELLALLNASKSWDRGFKTSHKKYAAIVGNIYERSLNTFTKEFFFNADDIDRSNLRGASSIFIFSKQSMDDTNDDMDNILRVLTVRAFIHNTPIFAQVMNPRLVPKMLTAGATQAISIQELKMNLLAQSCLSPGFSTLLMNLLRSDLHNYNDFDEYGSGNSYEIFTQRFSNVFVGLPFKKVANFIYDRLGMIVFGIESVIHRKQRIKMNPSKDYIIQDHDSGILLAKSKLSARRIRFVTLEMLAEKNVDSTNDSVAVSTPLTQSHIDGIRCKLILSEKVDGAKSPKNRGKSLHRLIIEKKKELNHDLSVLQTVHRLDNPSANVKDFFNNSNSNTSNTSNNNSSSSGGAHQHQRYNSNNSDTSNIDFMSSEETLSEGQTNLSPVPSDLSLTMGVYTPPLPPPLAQSTKAPKQFWTTRYFQDYLVDTCEDIQSINNHIILAGHIMNIEFFIHPLRDSYLRRYDPIVVLTPKFPESEWEKISKYPEVYIVEGNAAIFRDLKRAGILKCSKLVVLSQETHSREPFINDKDTLLAIICAKDVIKKHNIFPIWEL
ncbi:hypothetical protein SAMD00019534_065090, partial [Acytostelium subglobosum LB1]|uniref:hypothetical protein n=1 Tax=Acytostelium subglobosum LB1 TaxID=1410327 RepID=UPI000644AAF4